MEEEEEEGDDDDKNDQEEEEEARVTHFRGLKVSVHKEAINYG